MIELSVAVAHHPHRDILLPHLLDRLDEPVNVVTDTKPERMNAWKNAKNAWRAGVGKGTHHLVLENDIIPCRDFLPAVREALVWRPFHCVRFYSPNTIPVEVAAVSKARLQYEHWVPLEFWGGIQACAIPEPWIEPFIHWGESYPEHTSYPDSRMREWLRARHMGPAWTTVPSLVEHGHEPSLAGNPNHSATWFIGENESALGIDWS